MNQKPISDLRRRLLEDMAVRRLGEKTQHDYIKHVETFAIFLGRSPDTATPEELRSFQLHLTKTGVRPPTVNATVTALRFFFKVTLDRPETTRRLVFVYEPRKLPRVLSPEEANEAAEIDPTAAQELAQSCPCCGGRMIVIETFAAGCQPRYRPTVLGVAIVIDTS